MAYGWTFSEIRKLTMREIHIAMTRISESKKHEFGIKAALAGVKLPSGYLDAKKNRGEKNPDFTEQDDAKAMGAVEQAKQRIKGRFKK